MPWNRTEPDLPALDHPTTQPTREPTAGAARADSGGRTLSIDQVRRLPAVVDLVTAARALGIGRTTAYAMVRRGEFPVTVFKTGATFKVPTAPLLVLLQLDRNSAG